MKGTISFIFFYIEIPAKYYLTKETRSLVFESFGLRLETSKNCWHYIRQCKKLSTHFLSRSISCGTTKRATGSGGRTKMTTWVLCLLLREARYNRRASLAELTSSLPMKVNTSTIHRALYKMGGAPKQNDPKEAISDCPAWKEKAWIC